MLADGRLEQPISYWNGEGALAAMGLVLAARVTGDTTRATATRALAAAATAPLAAGVYLSFSRGAMAAGALGLLVVLAVAPTRAQLRGCLVVLASVVCAVATTAAFRRWRRWGSSRQRVADGRAALVLLVAAMVAASLVTVALARRERAGRLPVHGYAGGTPWPAERPSRSHSCWWAW